MHDAFKRPIDYLRISITDRCNLRCVYCMPEEGVHALPHEAILTYDEILHVCRVMADMGVRKIKITGGEPLVRKNVDELIADIKAVPGIENVTLTTNGVLLEKMMPALSAAGIDSINVSLDTLDSRAFQEITRIGVLDTVLAGIEKALEYPHIGLKVNCVPTEIRRERILEMAEMARTKALHLRFIEVMPIGLGRDMVKKEDTETCISQILEAAYGSLVPYHKPLGNGPAHYFSLPGFTGKIGFISAVSHQFCDTCNRMRLTSNGFLKACLQYDIGEDLFPLLRGNAPDAELKSRILLALSHKPQAHDMQNDTIEHGENHGMSQIGG